MEGTMLILRFLCNFWSTKWINLSWQVFLVGVGVSYTKCCLQFGLANNSGMANNSWQNRAIAQNRVGYYHFEVPFQIQRAKKGTRQGTVFVASKTPMNEKNFGFSCLIIEVVMVGSSLRSELRYQVLPWLIYPSPSWALPMPKSHKNMPQTLRGSTL